MISLLENLYTVKRNFFFSSFVLSCKRWFFFQIILRLWKIIKNIDNANYDKIQIQTKTCLQLFYVYSILMVRSKLFAPNHISCVHTPLIQALSTWIILRMLIVFLGFEVALNCYKVLGHEKKYWHKIIYFLLYYGIRVKEKWTLNKTRNSKRFSDFVLPLKNIWLYYNNKC